LYSKILTLRFPKTGVSKPTVCHLSKDYGLIFTILKATVLPRKEGIMVLEVFGPKKNFKKGIAFLQEQGVLVQNASQEVNRNTKKCIHCGACTAVCPTGALAVKHPELSIDFNIKKCSVCELCVPACPTKAMKVQPTSEAFF
jgi:ferredoxin